MTTTTPTMKAPGPIEATKYGDVDCNGIIEINDIVLLSRYVAQDTSIPNPPTEQGLANADCVRDNSIDSGDITAISRYLAHLIEESDLGQTP